MWKKNFIELINLKKKIQKTIIIIQEQQQQQQKCKEKKTRTHLQLCKLKIREIRKKN